MRICPPKPGSTPMMSTMSNWLMQYSIADGDVPGDSAMPARAPARLM